MLYKIQQRSPPRLSVDMLKDTSTTVQFTREAFARFLADEGLMAEFSEFIELEHCSENLLFYKELALLEDLAAAHTPAASIDLVNAYEAARAVGATQVLARFLRAANANNSSCDTSQQQQQQQQASHLLINLPSLSPSQPVPQKLIQVYADFCKFFFLPGSPYEVNITASSRRRLLTKVFGTSDVGADTVPVGLVEKKEKPEVLVDVETTTDVFEMTVFDKAADEVLDMLYRDTFRRFVDVKQKQQQQQQQLSQSLGSPSMAERNSVSSERTNSPSTGGVHLLGRSKSKPSMDSPNSPPMPFTDPSTMPEKKHPFWKRQNTKKSASEDSSTSSLSSSNTSTPSVSRRNSLSNSSIHPAPPVNTLSPSSIDIPDEAVYVSPSSLGKSTTGRKKSIARSINGDHESSSSSWWKFGGSSGSGDGEGLVPPVPPLPVDVKKKVGPSSEEGPSASLVETSVGGEKEMVAGGVGSGKKKGWGFFK
ncbi:hypothetical protein HDV05_000926 [Chytridiales sp. JEL 0842]|nr:hypothetical protein HDV05_000926 [Chytridiales sp. JEL 0842]